MKIYITSGQGTGRTTLSAFDTALKNAGVYNYNLIPLSSIIPPKAKIIRKRKFHSDPEEFGHKLYVVKAEIRSQQVGKHIAAGIGWYQLDDGRGLFVEHEEIAETRLAVESEIQAKISNSLKDMCKSRGIPFKIDDIKSMTMVMKVSEGPSCVLAIAVYQSEGWVQ